MIIIVNSSIADKTLIWVISVCLFQDSYSITSHPRLSLILCSVHKSLLLKIVTVLLKNYYVDVTMQAIQKAHAMDAGIPTNPTFADSGRKDIIFLFPSVNSIE